MVEWLALGAFQKCFFKDYPMIDLGQAKEKSGRAQNVWKT